MVIRVYFEGNDRLRPGFRKFFDELYLKARSGSHEINFIATGATPAEDYETALKQSPEAWNILLRDSEGVVARGTRLGPSEFLMVQMMESWFLADKSALETYYGQAFVRGSLPKNPAVEEISKAAIEKGLLAATRKTQKGKYHKTRHAPEILAAIDPARVKEAAPNCQRMFDFILREIDKWQ